jgi:FkbM family methyltransferase
MPDSKRKLAFVLAASDHGAMIVSRLDYRMTSATQGIGVGYDILEYGAFDPREVAMTLSILELRRQYFKDGVVAIDCGANVGVHTIEWAKRMTGWGSVLAIEAQERIYYALAGNIVINNCFNAVALHAAISDKPGVMMIPVPDYLMPASFGSLELRKTPNTEFIGQPVDYSEASLTGVQAVSIDSGAAESIARSKPALLVESIKTNTTTLREWLGARDYHIFHVGMNFLAVHNSDPIRPHIK